MSHQADYIRRHPERQKAYGAVKRALMQGKLVKPGRCARCGDSEAFGVDGRSLLHAHHHNGYDNPLDVEWLCSKCHKAEDGGAKGARNPKAKLTPAQVLEIRKSCELGILLAAKYRVDPTTISQIRHRKIWPNSILSEKPE